MSITANIDFDCDLCGQNIDESNAHILCDDCFNELNDKAAYGNTTHYHLIQEDEIWCSMEHDTYKGERIGYIFKHCPFCVEKLN